MTKQKKKKKEKVQHTCKFFFSSVSEREQKSGEGTVWTHTVWYMDNRHPGDLYNIHKELHKKSSAPTIQSGGSSVLQENLMYKSHCFKIQKAK